VKGTMSRLRRHQVSANEVPAKLYTERKKIAVLFIPLRQKGGERGEGKLGKTNKGKRCEPGAEQDYGNVRDHRR